MSQTSDKIEYNPKTAKVIAQVMMNLNNMCYNETCSEYLPITRGVPQGSILGPLLFILYINDLLSISKLIDFVIFADDTNLVLSAKDLRQLSMLLNLELEVVSTWFKVNKLTVNIEKTNFTVFGTTEYVSDISVLIDKCKISKANEVKILGINIDNKLSWKNQIKHVENKVAKGIGIMYQMKSKLNNDALKILYLTMVFPYLNYCAEVWGNTYPTKLNHLEVLQKRCIRLLSNLKFRDHTSKHFGKHRCLKLRDIIKLKTCALVYEAENGTLPTNLQNLYMKTNDIHNYLFISLNLQ